MNESEAVAIALKYATEHGLPHERLRQAVFIPIGHPSHVPWMNDFWMIFFDSLTPRPLGMEDFGGLLILVDCKTGEASLHRPM